MERTVMGFSNGRSILTIFILFTLLFLSQANGQTPDQAAEREARAQSTAKARFDHAASKDYSPDNAEIAEIRNKAEILLKTSKLDEAIAETDRGLEKDMFSIQLYALKTSALRSKGNLKEADVARNQLMAVIDSILLGGDGGDFATAYKVISAEEEFAVLRIKDLQKLDQSSAKQDGVEFDVFKVKDQKGAESTLYFNVDILRKWEAEHKATIGVETKFIDLSKNVNGSAAAPSVQKNREPFQAGSLQGIKLIKRVSPVYPELAKRARVSGIVSLIVTVDEQGNVTDIKILKGEPLLNQAAIEAVWQWKYTPMSINGEPVPVIGTVNIVFDVR
jgi:TonB family protein